VLNEGENLKILIPKIDKEIKKKYEIIIVDDDSNDDTENIVKRLKKKYPIKYILRKDKKGLSSAVIDGIAVSKGDTLLVMDSDLSHPPEIIHKLLKEIKNNDIVVASRYTEGGGADRWILPRKMISVYATLLARPLVKVKDPMAGFFIFKKSIIRNSELKPLGFKILLEILVKGRYSKYSEVPYIFQKRHAGKSKANLKVYVQYHIHLFKLYYYKFMEGIKKIFGGSR
jgi:dolichol-phosphate mannosyltransferase